MFSSTQNKSGEDYYLIITTRLRPYAFKIKLLRLPTGLVALVCASELLIFVGSLLSHLLTVPILAQAE